MSNLCVTQITVPGVDARGNMHALTLCVQSYISYLDWLESIMLTSMLMVCVLPGAGSFCTASRSTRARSSTMQHYSLATVCTTMPWCGPILNAPRLHAHTHGHYYLNVYEAKA